MKQNLKMSTLTFWPLNRSTVPASDESVAIEKHGMNVEFKIFRCTALFGTSEVLKMLFRTKEQETF